MTDLFTRALYKVSSQDHHVWNLYTRSPARSRHEIPTKDFYERSLWQELLTRSLRKTSIRQGPYEMFQLSTRSLPKTCMRDFFTRALYKISSVSSQELSTRSLRKTSMRDLYTRALYDLYESLYKIFARPLQDLFTRPIYERSLYKSSLQDLFTRPLWEISIQELSTKSLHKTTMRDLVTRALYKISSQDPIWDISMQDLLASLDLLGLFTGALYKISSQDLYMRGL